MARIPLTGGAGRLARQFRPNVGFLGPALPATSCFLVRQSTTRTYNQISIAGGRCFSSSRPFFKGLSPESENPQPKVPEPQNLAQAPAELSMEEYHQLSDQYFEALVDKLEALQEAKEDLDCEYSAGILTLETPNGKYILNKQPPNKQIWLSAPESGPKRYDFVMQSEGQDAKEGTGTGQWIYLRDGSSLNDLLQLEIGVDMSDSS